LFGTDVISIQMICSNVLPTYVHGIKKPVLNIVDAYRIMHKNGPQGKSLSDVAQLKTLIASTNIVATDTAALRFFNQVEKLDISAVGHIGKGEALKLGTSNLDKLTIKRIKI